MSQLELQQGLRSQILRILVNIGQSDVAIVDSTRLYYAEEKSNNFEDILISVNKKSQRPFISPQNAEPVMEFINSALNAAESNNVETFCNELNNRLCLKTFIVGNTLSAADVAAFVCIYTYFAKTKNEERYAQLLNVSRWFDMVQFNIKSANILEPISIPKSVPPPPSQKSKAKKPAPKSQQEQPKGKGKGKGKKNKRQKSKAALIDHRNEIEFIEHRIKTFEAIYKRQCEERNNLPDDTIDIKLPDGSVRHGIKFKTTPLEIALSISKGLAKACIVSKVNGALWDLTRPLESNVDLVLLKWDSDEAKNVFWHSSSHVLGQSMERMLKGKLTIGPALDPSQMLHNGGFYYDVNTADLGSNLMLSQSHYDSLEQLIKKQITSGKGQAFERIEMTRSEAEEMFKFNKYKQEIIGDIFDTKDVETVSAYRCGDLIDLCIGPHIPNTNRIKSFKITKNGATYWKNDNKRDFLQRLYGISFPDKKLMKEYAVLKAKAAEADHRNIGKQQDLFFFHDLSPGSCFWLPHGTRIYNKLREFISAEYVVRGFTPVVSPNVFNFDLWRISGHAQNYRENMFIFECEEQEFGLKPMNCPGHCLMFAQQLRSYRDLPIRFADFGALHRNELSGSLSGLTRVRRFQQDDAHIFCRHDQIAAEIENCLDFMAHVYGVFGFEFELELSTRPPQKYLGEIAVWDRAEAQLQQSLDKFVNKCNAESKTSDDDDKKMMRWKLNPGDGAFYGPKIDIKVFDSLNRQHQCATIQLDFQLPLRFGLSYSSSSSNKGAIDPPSFDEDIQTLRKKYLHIHSHKASASEVPVMIHRAIYGSFERFIAILTEHLLGKWPFWISPRQICVVPVTKEFNLYAKECGDVFADAGYWCDVDESRDRLNKKIRKAQTNQYNFICVVGAKEEENKTVNIRSRDNKEHGQKTIKDALQWFDQLTKSYQ
eukprot:1166659_1